MGPDIRTWIIYSASYLVHDINAAESIWTMSRSNLIREQISSTGALVSSSGWRGANGKNTRKVPSPIPASGSGSVDQFRMLPLQAFSSVSEFRRLAIDEISRYSTIEQPGIERCTSSKESLIRYLIVVTLRFWPTRCTRQRACSSTIGFQWGSSKYARDAAVRSRLFYTQHNSKSYI